MVLRVSVSYSFQADRQFWGDRCRIAGPLWR